MGENELDLELVNRVQRGDKTAFDLLVLKYQHRIGAVIGRFVPDYALIAFAGDISLAEARTLVEAKLGGWKKSGAPKPTTTQPPTPGPAKVYLVARPNSVQTSLAVGTQSMVRTDPDYVPLTVANRVLGGTMGRLFRHLREEKGYTYGASAGFDLRRGHGPFTARAAVNTEATVHALHEFLAELDLAR